MSNNNKLDTESVLKFLNDDTRNRFCIVDYSDNRPNYEIIYRIIDGRLIRKKWDTHSWTKTKFLNAPNDVFENDINKANRFNEAKNPHKYTKLYTYLN